MKFMLLFSCLWVFTLGQHKSTSYQNSATTYLSGNSGSTGSTGHGYATQSGHPEGAVSGQYSFQSVDGQPVHITYTSSNTGSGTYTADTASATKQQASHITQQQSTYTQPAETGAAAVDTGAAAVDTAAQYTLPQTEVQQADAAAGSQQTTVLETQQPVVNEYTSQQQTQTVAEQPHSVATTYELPNTYQSAISGSGSNTYHSTGTGGSSGTYHTSAAADSGSSSNTYQPIASGTGGSSYQSTSTGSGTHVQYPQSQHTSTTTNTGTSGTSTAAGAQTTHFTYPQILQVPSGLSGSKITGNTHFTYPTTFQVVSSGGGIQGTTSVSGQRTQTTYPNTLQVVAGGTGGSGTTTGSQTTSTTTSQGGGQFTIPFARPSVVFTSPGVISSSSASNAGTGGQTQFSYYPHLYYPQFPHIYYPNFYIPRPIVTGIHQTGGGVISVPATAAPVSTTTPIPVTARPTVVSPATFTNNVPPVRVRPQVTSTSQQTTHNIYTRPVFAHGHQFVSSGPSYITYPSVSYQQPTNNNQYYQYRLPGQNVVSYFSSYPATVATSSTQGSPYRSSSQKGASHTAYTTGNLPLYSAQSQSYFRPYSTSYSYQLPVQAG